jgi:hypothetical protein
MEFKLKLSREVDRITMIWGIPRSKGGIKISKPFWLRLYVIFSATILTAYTKLPPKSEGA